MKWLEDQIKQYWWKLLGLAIAGTVAWTNLSGRVESHDAKITKLEGESKEHHDAILILKEQSKTIDKMDHKLDRLLRR